MNDSWIKMRTELPRDPRVLRMARALSIDAFGIVGRLHAVWSWLDAHSDDGESVRVLSDDVDDVARTNGFADAMRSVEWLAGDAENVTFPGYARHNGTTAKTRAIDSKRKNQRRKKVSDKCPTNVRTKTGPEREGEIGLPKGNPASVAEAEKPHHEHARFVTLWTEAYPAAHGGEKYAFQGGKDGTAVKALLVTSGKSPEELMRIAVAAWKNPAGFNCKMAASLCGFNSKFNDIRNELNALKNGTPANQPTSRNTGHNAGVSYADRPKRPAPATDPADTHGNG